ncbi:MAG TPA: resolvase [Ruminococcaceae bacterium]|nr:resolvase [Oscillospiraceae bacterium]
MIYGYARVSTKGQARNGNSLEAQQGALKANGAEKIFADSFTGTKISRPELDKLLALLQPGDTLMVTKLDRIARSLAQGSTLVTDLISKGIKVNILNIGIMDNTPSSKLIRNIFFSFAEFERDMIVERTQEGKAVARETKPNYKEGRHKVQIKNFENYKKRVQRGELTVTQAAKELGISRRTWYNLKTA